MIAHIGEREVRSPLPGEVRALEAHDGAAVKSGGAIAELSADKNHVFEALRALVLVGQKEDLEDVRRYTRPVNGMPEVVFRQAQLTVQAIERKAE
jgi:hypothetical protein